MGEADPASRKNEVHELENWRIRIRREEGCADKWEDWWGWMVKEEDRAHLEDVKGNTRSFINTKDVPKPAFAGSRMLRAHYGSMMPSEKYHTTMLESHKYGGKLGAIGARQPFASSGHKMGANPLEPLGLATRRGRVDARLETNDPISFDERVLKLPHL